MKVDEVIIYYHEIFLKDWKNFCKLQLLLPQCKHLFLSQTKIYFQLSKDIINSIVKVSLQVILEFNSFQIIDGNDEESSETGSHVMVDVHPNIIGIFLLIMF